VTHRAYGEALNSVAPAVELSWSENAPSTEDGVTFQQRTDQGISKLDLYVSFHTSKTDIYRLVRAEILLQH
jgi:hypothetical protein